MSSVQHPARRGDLVVIERVQRDYVIGRGSSECRRFEVYEVAGLFRDGRIKTVRSLAWSDASPEPLARMVGFERSHVIDARRIDKDAVVKAVQAHRWPGHEDSALIKPFDSLDEVKELIKPFMRAVAA